MVSCGKVVLGVGIIIGSVLRDFSFKVLGRGDGWEFDIMIDEFHELENI